MQGPVLVTAVVSVPAVFLSTLDGSAGTAGTVLNRVTVVVRTGESVLLFWFSSDRIACLRSPWWVALVAALAVPAVLFAIGPVRVLRAARLATAFQLPQVTLLIKVARILRCRTERIGSFRHVPRVLAVAGAGAVWAKTRRRT